MVAGSYLNKIIGQFNQQSLVQLYRLALKQEHGTTQIKSLVGA